MNRDKIRIHDLARMKAEGRPIAALTAYDYPFARIFDQAGVDLLLVGDSLAMVVRGEENTLGVTVDEMLYHVKMVARARSHALLVADMPFLSYQASLDQAVQNAGRMLKEGGAEAVKLEGGIAIAQTVRRLVELDIPVMGHVGLTPQSIHRMGGLRVQGQRPGRGPGGRERLLEDAAALEAAGAFAVVLEGMPAELAQEITLRLSIPTIGIGAGPACDGQVLVMHDVLGFTESPPRRFAKAYADLWKETAKSALSYLRDVRERAFPGTEHCYHSRAEGGGGGARNGAA